MLTLQSAARHPCKHTNAHARGSLAHVIVLFSFQPLASILASFESAVRFHSNERERRTRGAAVEGLSLSTRQWRVFAEHPLWARGPGGHQNLRPLPI